MHISYIALIVVLWFVVPQCIDSIASSKWLIPVQLLVVLFALMAYTATLPDTDQNYIGPMQWLGIAAGAGIYYFAMTRRD